MESSQMEKIEGRVRRTLSPLAGFKDFIMRGNVIDLAVGIVIGAAFTGLVTSFTGSFIEPLLRVFGASSDPRTAGTWTLAGQQFQWAGFLNALITFVLTAAVLYFLIVLPMNKLAERRNRGVEPPPQAPSEEIRLLTEIRDALIQRDIPQQREEPTPRP
jgi:large conductance mechanosensitive channel